MYLGARHLQGFPLGRGPLLGVLQTCALVEVKVLHTRILAEMFLPRKQPDDVNVVDLVPDLAARFPNVAHNLQVAYGKKLKLVNGSYSSRVCLNKFLAHPDRRRGDRFDWAPVIRTMDGPLRAAIRTLPRERFDALRVLGKYLDA